MPRNNTLYINNLNERVRLEDLKEELNKVFSEFGSIIEIKAKKDIRMRGQAFVVFDDISSAKKALEALNKKLFFGKELVI